MLLVLCFYPYFRHLSISEKHFNFLNQLIPTKSQKKLGNTGDRKPSYVFIIKTALATIHHQCGKTYLVFVLFQDIQLSPVLKEFTFFE